MINLNILPPEEKNAIASQKLRRQIVILNSYALISILTFLVLLSSIWLFLLVQLKSIEKIFAEAQTSPQGKAFEEFKKEIGRINQSFQYFDQLRDQRVIHSVCFERLIQILPSGVRFNSVSVSQDQVALEGYAATRESLMLFKDSLEKSQYFEEVESPLSNFLKQRDINFSFRFKIKQ